MRAMQRHVLRWFSFEKEQRHPQHGSILLVCATAHPLHTRVVGYVLPALQHFAALDLPTAGNILHVVETFPNQRKCKTHVDSTFLFVICFWVLARADVWAPVRSKAATNSR